MSSDADIIGWACFGQVAALPENLRFAGLLALIGTVLISVATVQFGGHPIF